MLRPRSRRPRRSTSRWGPGDAGREPGSDSRWRRPRPARAGSPITRSPGHHRGRVVGRNRDRAVSIREEVLLERGERNHLVGGREPARQVARHPDVVVQARQARVGCRSLGCAPRRADRQPGPPREVRRARRAVREHVAREELCERFRRVDRSVHPLVGEYEVLLSGRPFLARDDRSLTDQTAQRESDEQVVSPLTGGTEPARSKASKSSRAGKTVAARQRRYSHALGDRRRPQHPTLHDDGRMPRPDAAARP